VKQLEDGLKRSKEVVDLTSSRPNNYYKTSYLQKQKEQNILLQEKTHP